MFTLAVLVRVVLVRVDIADSYLCPNVRLSLVSYLEVLLRYAIFCVRPPIYLEVAPLYALGP